MTPPNKIIEFGNPNLTGIEMPRQGKYLKEVLKNIKLKDKDFYILSLKKVSEKEADGWGKRKYSYET